MRKKYYDPDAPEHIDKSIARTERKLEMLHIRKQIRAIDERLKSLGIVPETYPPPEADDAQPLAVHTAPSS